MKIGIDARWIFPEISGVGKYTEELIRHLARIDRANEYLLFFDRPEVRERTWSSAELEKAPHFNSHIVSCPIFSARNQWILPGILRRLRLDVFHSTNYMIPLPAFSKRGCHSVQCVVTIHDLIPFLFRDHAPKAKKSRLFPLYKRLMLEIGRRADRIVTPSEASRNDIIRQLRIPPARAQQVVVIPEGIPEGYRPAPRKEASVKTILYVGRFDPYKNAVGLIEAFANVWLRDPHIRLEVIGSPDPRYPEAPARAKALGVDAAIAWRGYLDDRALREAYQQADLFVLPSRYEGFGLPVLEAMACGTPVICSRVSSLPEVAGDAAILIDPDHTKEVADAMWRVLHDDAFAKRLAEKGTRQAAKFSWERAARRTLEVYTRVARK